MRPKTGASGTGPDLVLCCLRREARAARQERRRATVKAKGRNAMTNRQLASLLRMIQKLAERMTSEEIITALEELIAQLEGHATK